jgi:hypothetical protein
MKIKHTIWGYPQDIKPVEGLEGVAWVSTSSHGGYVLSDERADELAEKFPDVVPFAGSRNHWEEDCDWVYVVLTWPDFFPEQQAKEAKHNKKITDSYKQKITV